MLGLTLNTEAASTSGASQLPPAESSAVPSSATPATAPPAHVQPSPPRSSSPSNPPAYSPITPPLKPTLLPPRPEYTHNSQTTHTPETAITAPPPEPIDFDSNPDVLALKSAIAVLQIQKRKAMADMVTLDRAKREALEDPEAFVQDLRAGRLGVEEEGLFVGGVRAHETKSDAAESSSESDSEGDHAMEDADMKREQATDGASQPSGAERAQDTSHLISAEKAVDSGMDIDGTRNSAAGNQTTTRSWTKIPKPQNVVRCPPVNWTKYAVVGESLDKMHREQLAAPVQGTPAVINQNGQYDFRGDSSGKQEELVGIAAPYNPLRDKLEKKPKVPKR
jgi:hypothetical protein